MRRLLVSATLLASSLGPARLFAADDWPQLLGPTRNGVYGGPALSASWSQDGPVLLWKKSVGQGFSGPVVSGSRLVLFHRKGDREVVECLEAATGRPLWSTDSPTAYRDDFGFDEGPRSVPTLADGRVYTFGAEGFLQCLDLEKGGRLWSVETAQLFRAEKGFFGACSSPLVEGERVLMIIGGKRPGAEGRGAGIVAFEKSSGKVAWTATDERASYSSPVAATIGGKRHALFFTFKSLVDLDPLTGAERFSFPWGSRHSARVNAATPLVVGDLIFVSASYETGAAALRVGERGLETLWSGDDILSNHYATSVERDGFLYGFDGRQESAPHLRCVELRTGKVRWTKDHFGAGSITLAGDKLLILTEGGELILAPATAEGFQPAARARPFTGTLRAFPAIAGGRLYARNGDTLFCLDLRPRS